MPEYICGKKDRCKHGENCPLKLHPLVHYICFERGAVKWQEKNYLRIKSKLI